MQALLGNLGLDKAIVDTEKMTNTITSETLKKAKNTIILSLDDLEEIGGDLYGKITF